METQTITIAPGEARTLYREYRKHVHYSTPIDREVIRAYQLLAQGRLVIKALESVVSAGLDANSLPRLALAPANATSCEVRVEENGGLRMDSRNARTWRNLDERRMIAERAYFRWPRGTFRPTRAVYAATAMVSGAPLHLRPRRGLANYHVLWEPEWTRVAPYDPFLLRRIGKADMWAVLAMWQLTEVERAALATRL